MIVQKPFGRWRDGRSGVHIGRRGAVDPQDFLLVLPMPGEEFKLHDIGERLKTVPPKAVASLPEFFNGQICCPDRIVMVHLLEVGVPWRGGRSTIEGHDYGF